MTAHQKRYISLRGWMQGAKCHVALRAMAFAESYHTGKRKGGDPEFSHQVWMASFARTLVGSIDNIDLVLAVIFLHDLCEDYDVAFGEIERLFGAEVADAVRRLTKIHRGVSVPKEVYFREIGLCPIASLVKGIDRLHNLSTMVGVFNMAKQVEYIAEAREGILTALKVARRLFPTQEAAYENIKQAVNGRIDLIEAIWRANAADAAALLAVQVEVVQA